MKKLLLLLTAVLISLSGFSQSFEYNGLQYNVISENDLKCEVAKNSNVSGNLVIPETAVYENKTYSVISIRTSAFYGCSGLTSVTIPNSVTSIDIGAFANCRSLTSVEISNSVISIGDYVFRDCSGLETVTIGNSVTGIGTSAFEGCLKLTKVEISDLAAWCNIKFDNEKANPTYYAQHFYLDSEEITDLVIPNSVTSIGNWAFEGCSALKSVTIPNSVTEIGGYAFSACSGLTSVDIPNSVTSIGNGAFSGCTGLTSVTIPNSLTSIGERTFYYCRDLTSITIPNSVTSIGDLAFANCIGLTSVTIPNSLTSIGNGAFSGSAMTGELDIPDSVESIGAVAFFSCTKLTAIYIGKNVKTIGSRAFENTFTDNLKEVVCAATTPPTGDNTIFAEIAYTTATLYVPSSSLNSYKEQNPWNNFHSIKTLEESGVDEVGIDESETLYDVFNLNGQLVKRQASQSDIAALDPGIYIIGGKKVIVK